MIALFAVSFPVVIELSLGGVLACEPEPGCSSEDAKGHRGALESLRDGAHVDGSEWPWVLDTFFSCAYLPIRYSQAFSVKITSPGSMVIGGGAKHFFFLHVGAQLNYPQGSCKCQPG